MKKLVTLFDIESIPKLSKYADGFILGHEGVATRLTRSFSELEIIEASKLAKAHNKLVYITMNRILHDLDAKRYESFIKTVDSEAISGYIVGDIGVLSIAKKMGLSHKIVYNPETLITNVFDAHFYHTLGIQGVYLAKEITLEDILQIGQNRPYKLFAYGHGFLNMFYSKRQLIEAYFENIQKPNLVHDSRNLSVVEEKRPQYRYPILEDEAGTHVFRNNVYASINYLTDLSNAIDFLVFDTIFHNDDYALKVLELYEKPNPDQAKELQAALAEVWDEGFLFKKTVYKPKKVEL